MLFYSRAHHDYSHGTVYHLKAPLEASLIQGEINPPRVKYCLKRENRKKAREVFTGFLEAGIAEGGLDVYSAGTKPSGEVHSLAVQVMRQKGIDISNQSPVSVEQYLTRAFDLVITVCDGAKKSCPVFTGKVAQRLHIGFERSCRRRGHRQGKTCCVAQDP